MARTSRLVRGVWSVGVGRPGRDGDARGVDRAPRARWGLPVSKTTREAQREPDRKEQRPCLSPSLLRAVLGVRGPAAVRFSGLPPASLLTRPTAWRTGPL